MQATNPLDRILTGEMLVLPCHACTSTSTCAYLQFKCDVTDDCLLQDEPLQLRLFDYDVLSSDDVIGTVYVHCNSLYEGHRHEHMPRCAEDLQKRQIFGLVYMCACHS